MVSMLVDSDELTDESDKVRQIRVRHELVEDWADASWEPEPIDASPGKLTNAATELLEDEKCVAHESALGWPLIVSCTSLVQNSAQEDKTTFSARWWACTIRET